VNKQPGRLRISSNVQDEARDMKLRLTLLFLGLTLAVAFLLLFGRSDDPASGTSEADGPTAAPGYEGMGTLPVTTAASSGTRWKTSTDRIDPPRRTRSFLLHRLSRIAVLQNSDGTWGDRLTLLGDQWIDETGLTALVLAAFLQSGYSHLSKDDMDGVHVGVAIKNGLLALMRRQASDGSFATSGDPTVNQSLATWAFSEAYGMSATRLFLEPAQRAVEATGRCFSHTSGWGNDATSAWAALALSSARLSELAVDARLADRTREFGAPALESGSSPAAVVAWAVLRDERHRNEPLRIAAELARSRPVREDLAASLFDSIVIFHFEGSKAAAWETRLLQFSNALPDWEKPPEYTRTGSDALLPIVLESLHLSLWFWYPPEKLSELIAAPSD
jgi:hypothetical protein